MAEDTAEPRHQRPLIRHQRPALDVSGPGFGREHELQEVIAGIEARLAEIERFQTREYDDQLAVIEADTAPYAVAFVYEIRRLEHLLARQRITARLGKRRRRIVDYMTNYFRCIPNGGRMPFLESRLFQDAVPARRRRAAEEDARSTS